jgi:hypothetical protein
MTICSVVKTTGRETIHYFQYSLKDKIQRSYATTPPNIFILLCLIKLVHQATCHIILEHVPCKFRYFYDTQQMYNYI